MKTQFLTLFMAFSILIGCSEIPKKSIERQKLQKAISIKKIEKRILGFLE
ncbi:MAG: hypothetical protein LBQ08_04010 [Holosporaceae bacterium]|nr:hypothetical protein [Holosporaceae bacterium]